MGRAPRAIRKKRDGLAHLVVPAHTTDITAAFRLNSELANMRRRQSDHYDWLLKELGLGERLLAADLDSAVTRCLRRIREGRPHEGRHLIEGILLMPGWYVDEFMHKWGVTIADVEQWTGESIVQLMCERSHKFAGLEQSFDTGFYQLSEIPEGVLADAMAEFVIRIRLEDIEAGEWMEAVFLTDLRSGDYDHIIKRIALDMALVEQYAALPLPPFELANIKPFSHELTKPEPT